MFPVPYGVVCRRIGRPCQLIDRNHRVGLSGGTPGIGYKGAGCLIDGLTEWSNSRLPAIQHPHGHHDLRIIIVEDLLFHVTVAVHID